MFSPGQHVGTFQSKKENEIIVRFVVSEDAENLLEYINTLSREDTFITLSGEQYTLEEEKKYIQGWIEGMALGTEAALVSYCGDELISIANVHRGVRREKHIGTIGLSIKKEYRGQGIGSRVLKYVCTVSKQMGLRILKLQVYSPNHAAITLYIKEGFKEVGRIPEGALLHNEYVDEIIMVKKL